MMECSRAIEGDILDWDGGSCGWQSLGTHGRCRGVRIGTTRGGERRE